MSTDDKDIMEGLALIDINKVTGELSVEGLEILRAKDLSDVTADIIEVAR